MIPSLVSWTASKVKVVVGEGPVTHTLGASVPMMGDTDQSEACHLQSIPAIVKYCSISQ